MSRQVKFEQLLPIDHSINNSTMFVGSWHLGLSFDTHREQLLQIFLISFNPWYFKLGFGSLEASHLEMRVLFNIEVDRIESN